MTDTPATEPVIARMKDYPIERTVLGAVVLGGVVLSAALLFFVAVPKDNQQLISLVMGGMMGSFATIVTSIWKTSMTERQQQATIQAMAAAASTPLTTSTTTTTERVGSDVSTGNDPTSPEPDGAGKQASSGPAVDEPIRATGAAGDFPDEPPSPDGLGRQAQPGG